MSPRVEGNAQVAIAATRALPIPTKAVGYEQRTPVRTGHKPIKHGTPEGYDRHRELGFVPCKDCLAAVKAKPLRPSTVIESKCGSTYGVERHRKEGTPVCAKCLTARRVYDAEWRRRKGEGRDPLEGRARGPRFDHVKAQGLRDQGWTIARVAERMGVSAASIMRWTVRPTTKEDA